MFATTNLPAHTSPSAVTAYVRELREGRVGAAAGVPLQRYQEGVAERIAVQVTQPRQEGVYAWIGHTIGNGLRELVDSVQECAFALEPLGGSCGGLFACVGATHCGLHSAGRPRGIGPGGQPYRAA